MCFRDSSFLQSSQFGGHRFLPDVQPVPKPLSPWPQGTAVRTGGGWRLCANLGECLLERTSPKATKRISLKIDSLKCDQTTTSKKAREKGSYEVVWSSQFRWHFIVLLTLKLPPLTPIPSAQSSSSLQKRSARQNEEICEQERITCGKGWGLWFQIWPLEWDLFCNLKHQPALFCLIQSAICKETQESNTFGWPSMCNETWIEWTWLESMHCNFCQAC